MLTYGTLGENNPAARRYFRRSMAALPVLALSMAAATYAPGGKYVMAIAPGLFFLYIALEFRRYMFAQDELGRRIHFESIVMTYLTALAVAGAVGGLASAFRWNVNPMWFVMVEPIRAFWLYAIARRY
jgi:NAD(P)-dependent dehydrogenase (short-subunit alcohol dehydrogenase family)